MWYHNRNNIRNLVEMKKIEKNGMKEGGDNNNEMNSSVAKGAIATLSSEPSLSLPKLPNTRAYRKRNEVVKSMKHRFIKQQLISLSRTEWKSVFNRIDRRTIPGWTNVFYEKLNSIGNTCSLHLDSARIRSGKRKHNCANFWFPATCSGTLCNRKYIVSHRKELDDEFTVGFRVSVFSEEEHTENNIMRSRRLNGEERHALGKMFG